MRVVASQQPVPDCNGEIIRVDGPITLCTIPFCHQARTSSDGWQIREWTYQPALVPLPLGLLLLALFVLSLVWGVPGPRSPDFGITLQLYGLGLPIGVLAIGYGVWLLGRFRSLSFDAGAGKFHLQGGNVFVRSSRYSKEFAADDVTLRIHPVRTFLTRQLKKDDRFAWNGHALVLHLGEDMFVLACQRDVERLERCLGELPAVFRSMERATGAPIRGVAYR